MTLPNPPDANFRYSQDALLEIETPPPAPDFFAFWSQTSRAARPIPVHLEKREIAAPRDDLRMWEVEWDSWDKVRIGGWILAPRAGGFWRGVIVGHGYGHPNPPEKLPPGPPSAALFVHFRGFGRSRSSEIPGNAPRHVLHGIANRETYVHRGCAADVWSAATVLIELFPEVGENLHYSGGSFGGGIGALALPWDERFKKAFLDVPSFGNHPLRVQIPCQGSGQAVRRRWETHPEILDVLRYFDAAVAAKFIEIPTFIAAALQDPAVPPPGQFSVYNALETENLLFVRQTGHPTAPDDDFDLNAALTLWFSD